MHEILNTYQALLKSVQLDFGRGFSFCFPKGCTFSYNFTHFWATAERVFKIQPSQKGRFYTANEQSTNKRDIFCDFADFYLSLGNPQEAALKLGVRPDEAFAEGLRLIGEPRVRRHIKRRQKSGDARIEALAGLRRLAFGRINDALALLRDDCFESDFSALDLFNVSEIKRVKGGGVEIKFFDRLEALEKLSELEDKAADTAAADSFFSALRKTAEGDG